MKKIGRGDIIEFRQRYALILEKTIAGSIIFVPIEINVQYNHRALFCVKNFAELNEKKLSENNLYALCVIGRSKIINEMKVCAHLHPEDIDSIEEISIMEYNARNNENSYGVSGESPLALSTGMTSGSSSVWNRKRAPARRTSL
ncbi:hypothetical protein [Acetobacter oeni]|uniref:Uncharacterized protein n=1 Tax=Acetobacter oeni TaxID=304077 RepID=A0A511XJ28_9PROT|nr:hypothetical protein [Acetobacter oeni]MBB3882690.1 hypothetical protein [Acetobacter oeni]NHO18792.1 hypothetical protein [Acetobacter oeni]GBR07013.1 hypothetical protein AA21952_2204 [Acetobacter oeni LMG 21952]GEN62945.1 hypothetical protein AOE01nite_11690 [Acetobacter oeni]